MQSYDLGLVRTLVHLYETRSVTRTAERLFVSQPSASYALAKLRKLFNDELFIRTASGLVPTDRADSLYPRLRDSLAVIDDAVSGASSFDPARSRHKFRLQMTDLGEIGLLPHILQHLAKVAPAVSLEVVPFNVSTARRSLAVGATDAAICTPRLDAEDLNRDLLSVQQYCGICAPDHPRLAGLGTMDGFLAERHIVVNAELGHDQVEEAIRRLGHRKDTAVYLSRFSALPDLLARTEYVSTATRHIAEIFGRNRNIRAFELPFEVPDGQIALYTYKRSIASPAVSWLRETICEVLQKTDLPS